jgi:site-specific recombinase XerD
MQVRQVITDLHQQITGEEIPFKSVENYAEMFLATKVGETSEATLKSYKTNLRNFMDWLGERRNEDLNDIRSTDIASYRNSLLARVSQSTATNKIKSLRAMFTAAKQEGLCLKDPTASLKLKRKSDNDDNIQRRPEVDPEIRARS